LPNSQILKKQNPQMLKVQAFRVMIPSYQGFSNFDKTQPTQKSDFAAK